jgi:hypothetical protein
MGLFEVLAIRFSSTSFPAHADVAGYRGIDGSWALTLPLREAGFCIRAGHCFYVRPARFLATRVPLGIDKSFYVLLDSYLCELWLYLLLRARRSKWYIAVPVIYSASCNWVTSTTPTLYGWCCGADFHVFALSLHGRWPAWSMPSSFHFLFLTKANAGIVSVFLLYVFFAFNVVYQKNLSWKWLLLGAGHLGSLLLLCGC